jgi:HEAT repeat protein
VDAAKPPANPEVDALFATLTSPESAEEWEQAHSRLVELGDAALPTLTRELKSDDAFRREVAASALAVLGPAAAGAQSELRAALEDDSLHVRANVATALCAIPDQADVVFPVLTRLVVSEDEQVRQMSAVNLSSFGEEAAPHVPKLAEVLKVAPSDVLVPVVELLGRIGPEAESAAPQLQQIVFEQEGEAKQAATAALERINAKSE